MTCAAMSRIKLENEAEGTDGHLDRLRYPSLHTPRDSFDRCLMLHSCDLRHYIAKMRDQGAPSQAAAATDNAAGTATDWPLPSRNWGPSIKPTASSGEASSHTASWPHCEGADMLDHNGVVIAVKQSILHLADHSGFDSVCQSPLTVLTSLMCRHIQQLCVSMGRLADSHPSQKLPVYLLTLAVMNSEDYEGIDPLALERYWTQGVWNVAVSRQRAALQLRRAALERRTTTDTKLCIKQDNTDLAESDSRSALTLTAAARPCTPRSLLPMTAQGIDALPATVKISGLGQDASAMMKLNTGYMEASIPSPFGAPSANTVFLPSPSPARISPMVDITPDPDSSLFPPPSCPASTAAGKSPSQSAVAAPAHVGSDDSLTTSTSGSDATTSSSSSSHYPASGHSSTSNSSGSKTSSDITDHTPSLDSSSSSSDSSLKTVTVMPLQIKGSGAGAALLPPASGKRSQAAAARPAPKRRRK